MAGQKSTILGLREKEVAAEKAADAEATKAADRKRRDPRLYPFEGYYPFDIKLVRAGDLRVLRPTTMTTADGLAPFDEAQGVPSLRRGAPVGARCHPNAAAALGTPRRSRPPAGLPIQPLHFTWSIRFAHDRVVATSSILRLLWTSCAIGRTMLPAARRFNVACTPSGQPIESRD